MDTPKAPLVTLSRDFSFNTAAVTTGITVSYAAGVTTLTADPGAYTVDQLYKAVIDFHASADSNEIDTILPVVQDTRALEFNGDLVLDLDDTHALTPGTSATTVITSQALAFNGAGQPTATFVYENDLGVSTRVRFNNLQ